MVPIEKKQHNAAITMFNCGVKHGNGVLKQGIRSVTLVPFISEVGAGNDVTPELTIIPASIQGEVGIPIWRRPNSHCL